MNVSKKRDTFFDLLKTLAIFFVLNDHFTGFFAEEYFEITPFRELFSIFYGKFGVSIFALVTGYFAYLSGRKQEDAVSYFIKRYLFFFVSCLITDVLYYSLNIMGAADRSSLGMVISDSLSLGDFYCVSFWFIRDFFLGSIICYKLGKIGSGLVDLAIVTALFFLYNLTFITSVVAGAILYHTLNSEKRFFSKAVTRIVLLLILSFSLFYRFESSHFRYTSNTVRAFAFILLLNEFGVFRILSKSRLVSLIGSRTLAILTSHLIVDQYMEQMALNLSLPVLYLIFLAASVVLSVPIDYIVRFLYRVAYRYIDMSRKRLEEKMKTDVHRSTF